VSYSAGPESKLARASVGDIVRVDWLDAWEDTGPIQEKDWRDTYPVTTYGILVRLGETVTIAAEALPEGDGYRGVTHVPVGVVIRIVVLEECDGA